MFRLLSVEENKCHYPVKDENSLGMIRSIRDTPPAHFQFKVESFGMLSEFMLKSGGSKIQTVPFLACGFRWHLFLHPRGDKSRNGDGHISLYLGLVEAASFPVGLQLHAIFKLFLYDHIRKKYLVVEKDVCGPSVFDKLKTEDGFSHFIPLSTFDDKSSGFKDGESCVFGAEVYVLENAPVVAKDACLANFAPSEALSYVVDFSKIPSNKSYKCPTFRAGKTEWFISLERHTNREDRRFIIFSLTFGDPPSIFTLWRKRRNNRRKAVFGKGTMRIEDQLHGKHADRQFCRIFTSSVNTQTRSLRRTVTMDHLENPSNGYVLNGKMKVKVFFSLLVLL